MPAKAISIQKLVLASRKLRLIMHVKANDNKGMSANIIVACSADE
jgi:hypothetical protein